MQDKSSIWRKPSIILRRISINWLFLDTKEFVWRVNDLWERSPLLEWLLETAFIGFNKTQIHLQTSSYVSGRCYGSWLSFTVTFVVVVRFEDLIISFKQNVVNRRKLFWEDKYLHRWNTFWCKNTCCSSYFFFSNVTKCSVRAQNWAFCTGMSSMLAISHLLNAFWRSGNESVQVSSN